MGEQQPARLGQLDAGLAARALDQALADETFERSDVLAHGRLGVAELLGGAAEGARLREGLQGEQMAQLQSRPYIS